jgi:hypothetical protein
MRPRAIMGFVVTGALAGWGAVLAAPAQDYPGQATKALVWVQNREVGDAIPVVIHGSALVQPLPVEMTALPIVETRAVRQAWEYREVSVPAGQSIVASLTEAGEAGWEATGVQGSAGGASVILLKRPR